MTPQGQHYRTTTEGGGQSLKPGRAGHEDGGLSPGGLWPSGPSLHHVPGKTRAVSNCGARPEPIIARLLINAVAISDVLPYFLSSCQWLRGAC